MTTRPRRPALALLLPLALLPAPGCSSTPDAGSSGRRTEAARRDDPLEAARQLLVAATDRSSCDTALQQINTSFNDHPDRRPTRLTAEGRALLEKRFGLDEGELNEADSPNFTLLDAQHLSLCFLLRDAVRSLELENVSQAERAAAGFAWVMRQVMLQQPGREADPLPPEPVLRRGAGSATERAHVFLAVLHQMGLPGCLVAAPGVEGPWACGALVEVGGGRAQEKQVLLFDPRLGLPLPGAKGKEDDELARAFRTALPVRGPRDGQQIATLAGLRRQPESLAALAVDEKHGYGVTAEQARQARVELAVPLSALAPRTRALQDDLLPPAVTVRLAADPAGLLQQFGAAAGVDGGADGVGVSRRAAGLARRFLPEEQGGIDKAGREMEYRRGLIPLQALQGLVPAELRRKLEGDLGQRIWGRTSSLFLTFQTAPDMPRDFVLRGRLKEATAALNQVQEEIRYARDKWESSQAEVERDFNAWADRIYKAYGDRENAEAAARRGGSAEAAEAARARVEELWKEGQKTVVLLSDGISAGPRGAQATYLQALAMHEEAERAQARADQAAGAGDPSDASATRKAAVDAWKESAGWWDTYAADYGGALFTPGIRLLQARAQEGQGNVERARQLLEDQAGAPGDPDRTTRLYLARRLQTR
jgi:hypothetical protein